MLIMLMSRGHSSFLRREETEYKDVELPTNKGDAYMALDKEDWVLLVLLVILIFLVSLYAFVMIVC